MFTPKQNVRIRPETQHNPWSEYPKYGLVVREMAGGEYVIVNTGEELDIRVRAEDLEIADA